MTKTYKFYNTRDLYFTSFSALKENPVYGLNRLGVFYRQAVVGLDWNGYTYQLTDHLGNVRAVVKKTTTGIDISGTTDYYPFGMPMPNRHKVDAEGYRYAYQGQEKDPETGKEAFELRLWDGRIGRWLTTDTAGQYDSPYLGMGNNPVNSIDPDGGTDNPVFDKDGNYLGTTKSGFKGEPIIMKAKDFTKGMSDALALSKGTLLSKFKFSNNTTRSKIDEFIANYRLGDGLDIYRTIYIDQIDPDSAIDGKLYNAKDATVDHILIHKIRNSDVNYEPTVENIRNIINGHEVIGHVLNRLSGSDNDHIIITKTIINIKQFHHTTRRYKQFTTLQLIIYGGDFNDSKTLRKLYFNYAKKMFKRYHLWLHENGNRYDSKWLYR